MIKGYLRKLIDKFESNNIKISEFGVWYKIEFKHITYFVSGTHYYYIDSHGFISQELTDRPSYILDRLNGEIKRHMKNNIVEIKVVGNIENFKNKTIEDIKDDYIRIKERYEKSDSLKMSSRYSNVCEILEKLNNGHDVNFISGNNSLKTLIGDIGAGVGHKDIIHMRDII